MIHVRKSAERGHFDHGWLNTYHTFSFGGYQDPEQMRFRALRVINEDWVEPGRGFGTHPHHDMEIVTYVLEGELAHRDSLGTGSTIQAGELQCMTAGTGITHSEFNPSTTVPVHLYQIWLFPASKGLKPSYEQRAFPAVERRNRLRLVASSDGTDDSLTIRQDAQVYLATLDDGAAVSHALRADRHAWLQVLRGNVTINGVALEPGDGVAISEESHLRILSSGEAELLLFDLA